MHNSPYHFERLVDKRIFNKKKSSPYKFLKQFSLLSKKTLLIGGIKKLKILNISLHILTLICLYAYLHMDIEISSHLIKQYTLAIQLTIFTYI